MTLVYCVKLSITNFVLQILIVQVKMANLKIFQEPCKEFKDLIEGMDIPCDLTIPKEPPKWLDKEAFFRGQKYFHENTCSVIVACLRSLITGLFIQNLWY